MNVNRCLFVPFQTCGSDVNKQNINFSSKQPVPYFRGYIYNTQTNKQAQKQISADCRQAWLPGTSGHELLRLILRALKTNERERMM